MRPGAAGLALFALGSLALLIYSPLFSPDLALVPPGPVNVPSFTVFYYLPRIVLSGILLVSAVFLIFTETSCQKDTYWAYGMLGAILASWVFWLRG